MAKYLGEFPVNLADTEFRDYKRSDWAMYYIGSYGQIELEDCDQNMTTTKV